MVARDVGYLITNRDGDLFVVEVLFEVPDSDLTPEMRAILDFQGFTLRITHKQRIFNEHMLFLNISKISADFFGAATSNCIICDRVSEL